MPLKNRSHKRSSRLYGVETLIPDRYVIASRITKFAGGWQGVLLGMRYLALATDYDGTLATDGRTSPDAISALGRLRASGRQAILVSGRRLDELFAVFPQIDLFDSVVAENGAVVYFPHTREKALVGKPPPAEFMDRIKSLGVNPIEVGEVVVATWLPNQVAVLQAIQETGLELHIVFNKSAVMILPAGVNKATGLSYALRKLGLSFHEVVGVGDAENDQSFLQRCECSVAVANAAPSILHLADFVTQREAGEGVTELVDELIPDDLIRMQGKLRRNLISIGLQADGTPVTVSPYGTSILVAGPSGSGKSTVTTGIVERLIERTYQVCIVDPEGDYGASRDVITVGDRKHPASIIEVLSILEDPEINVSINLLGIELADRPGFFGQLFPSLRTLRTRTGRPHWMVLDEAHHLLPRDWGHLPEVLPQTLGETILVTVHPDHLATPILLLVDAIIAVGTSPEETIRSFSDASGHALSWPDDLSYQDGKVVVWFPRAEESPSSISILPPTRERIRHRRKYAEGNMRHHSFYFRGLNNRHNIKAQNLAIFSQIAEGIDDETWLFHLRRGDYSKWFRDAVKDSYLAEQSARVERQYSLRPIETRNLIRALIEARYTLPE
jgi:hydroxymethylpyrimidine pyrophosphatase-like HAD family hydrolase